MGRILDGTFSFAKEKFARFDPEFVTTEAFATLRGWDEPIVIPGKSNPRPVPAKDQKKSDQEQSAEVMAMDIDEESVEEKKYYNEPDRLGMRIPHELTVKDVADLIGHEHGINVIDVQTQNQDVMKWALGKWAEYYDNPVKDSIRNVISLEVSETNLGKLVERPRVVKYVGSFSGYSAVTNSSLGRWIFRIGRGLKVERRQRVLVPQLASSSTGRFRLYWILWFADRCAA